MQLFLTLFLIEKNFKLLGEISAQYFKWQNLIIHFFLKPKIYKYQTYGLGF